MPRYLTATSGLLVTVLAFGPMIRPCAAQSTGQTAQPGFNLFTAQQDVDIGRQSAMEAEKQLQLLNDPNMNQYLARIVQRLAAVAPGAKFPYTIKAVNAPEINAFALPGGPLYINKGTILAAKNEAELAGVLAHEMSHVALRHGTHQASNAYLAQSGLSLLGGLFGKSQGTTDIVNAIGGIGLNTVFLKFSRTAELEADATGAGIMARAGYDPIAMANFLGTLRAQQGRDPGSVEQFFSDHPAVAERETRIRQLAATTRPTVVAEVGGFSSAQAMLGQQPGYQAPANVASGNRGRLDVIDAPPAVTGAPVTVRVPPPAARQVRFAQTSGLFSINRPINWRPMQSQNSFAVTLAPDAGVIQTGDGNQHVVYGMILNHYAPFGMAVRGDTIGRYTASGPREGTLEDATNDLVSMLLRVNPYLRAEQNSARSETISGGRAYSVRLNGMNPLTGENERVTLFSRALSDGHVIYALGIVPDRYARAAAPAMIRMMRTLVINDAAAHRADTRRDTRTELQIGGGVARP